MKKNIYYLYTQFLSAIFWRRRKQRIAELQRYVAMICDRSGCSRADEFLVRCLHIVEHYHVPWRKSGNDEIESELDLVEVALKRLYYYRRRLYFEQKAARAEFQELGNTSPEQKSPDQRSRYAQVRLALISIGGEWNKLHNRIENLKSTRLRLGFLLHRFQFSYMLFLLCSRRNPTKTKNSYPKKTARLPQILQAT